jgi:hypothetical protein
VLALARPCRSPCCHCLSKHSPQPWQVKKRPSHQAQQTLLRLQVRPLSVVVQCPKALQLKSTCPAELLFAQLKHLSPSHRCLLRNLSPLHRKHQLVRMCQQRLKPLLSHRKQAPLLRPPKQPESGAYALSSILSSAFFLSLLSCAVACFFSAFFLRRFAHRIFRMFVSTSDWREYVVDEDGGEFPVGWEQRTTPAGVVYYVDHIHRTTTVRILLIFPTVVMYSC